MIITIPQSKLDKVNANIFSICSVSKEKFDDYVTDLDLFMPTADLITGRQDGTLGKKAFAKKYKKQLKRAYTDAEYMIYTIGLSLKKTNICFTCSDEEYELGYLKVFAEYVSNYFGVEYGKAKDILSEVKEQLKSYDKKERKLLDEDPDDLSDKKKKVRKKLIKDIRSSVHSDMNEDGENALERLACRYAIDSMVTNLMRADDPVFNITETGEIADFNPDACDVKAKDLAAQLLLPKDDEAVGDVVKKIVKELGCKYKYDDIKELGKEKILLLIAKVYIALRKYKSGDYDND